MNAVVFTIFSLLGSLCAIALGESEKSVPSVSTSTKGVSKGYEVELAKVGLDSKQGPGGIVAIDSLVVPQNAAWNNFVQVSGINLGQFSLVSKNSSIALAESVKHSLKVQFTASGSVGAQACSSGFSGCKDIVVQQRGQFFAFRIDNVELEILPVPQPCVSGNLKCSLAIPSWSLKNFVANKGLFVGPKVLAVLQHKNGISLIDAANGKLFFEFKNGPALKNLGVMSSVLSNEDGTLQIGFEHGIFVADFERDQFLVVRSNGVFEGELGLAAVGASAVHVALEHPDREGGAPLFAERELFLWRSDYFAGSLGLAALLGGARNLQETPARVGWVARTAKGLFVLGEQNDGSAELFRLNRSNQKFLPLKNYHLAGGNSQIGNAVLVDSSLFQLTTKGYFVHGDAGFVKLSVSGSGAEVVTATGGSGVNGNVDGNVDGAAGGGDVQLLGYGHAFWQQQPSSNGCSLAHGVQNANSPGEFLITGFSPPGSVQGKVRASDAGVSAVELKGHRLSTYVWLPLQ